MRESEIEMTDDELAAIERRAEAATAGPWDFWIRITADLARVLVGSGDRTTLRGMSPSDANPLTIAKLPTNINPSGTFMHNRDCVFIAHAREDVPRLIAEIRRLRAEKAGG